MYFVYVFKKGRGGERLFLLDWKTCKSKRHDEINLNVIVKVVPEAFTQKSTWNFSPTGAFAPSEFELFNASD